jgi:N-methylhydantoinase A
VESIAICTLFSFLHPDHERKIAQRLRKTGFFVSASYEVLPEYREYERMSTTAINAYVSPVLDRYLKRLEEAVYSEESDGPQKYQRIRFHVMQSNGGSISVAEARKMGVRCILSGPAGGVEGAKFAGERALKGLSSTKSPLRLLTFDMGGTSTDVSLIHGESQVTTEAQIGGFPIRLPILDIHTIGAGGGSIATIDPGGSLRVGPQSAGAVPGPACYGRMEGENTHPTVTDANIVLGYIDPDHFLGGEMTIYPDLAWQAIKRVGEQVKLDPIQTALGIIAIANAHMERALRVISIERGHDPRDFKLLSFGGAGGLHAADLARSLGVPRVIVPPYAATFSAFGMLVADVIKDYTQTVMLPGNTTFRKLRAHFTPLVDRGRQEVQGQGVPSEDIIVDMRLDMRYEGQSYELSIPFEKNFYEEFHHTHHRTYGYHLKKASVEIVNLRVKITGRVPQIPIQPIPEGESNPGDALLTHRPVIMLSTKPGSQRNDTKSLDVPFYHGDRIQPGNVIEGPAVVLRKDTTILIGHHDIASVDGFFNLQIDINAKIPK